MLGCWLCVIGLAVHGNPLVITESPIGFFTNVANRLLESQLNLSLSHIQLYPTNQYTPSVHQLLQVTANLYDSLTNRSITGYPYLPSVFRPVFASSGGAIYIGGYAEVTDTSVLNLPVLDLQSAKDRSTLRATSMVSGVPLIIGAKKGFPNFNQFAMQTQVQVTRKLQFHRLADSDTGPVNELDQMFVVGITNMFGVGAWSSYETAFPRGLRMVVIPDLTVILTNLETGGLLNPATWRYVSPIVATNIPANTWPPYSLATQRSSLVLPLASGPAVPYTNHVVLPNSTYLAGSDTFVPLTGIFERTPGTSNLYVPHWQLNLRTRLRFALIDTSLSPNRIVDYVNLDSTEYPLHITDALMHEISGTNSCDPQSTIYTPSASNGSMWCTNRLGGSTAASAPTFGIMNQINAGLGMSPSTWYSARQNWAACDFFRVQFHLGPLHYPGLFYSTNIFNAPFQPARNLYLVTSWQANDPLVHYTLSDLGDLVNTNRLQLDFLKTPLAGLLGLLNKRYQPWGGNPNFSPGSTAYDVTIKDPLVTRTDDWDFPTNQLPDLTWLGRVHRGTPWQTIYLKAPGTSLATWVQWTRNSQLVTNGDGVTWDAFFTQPTNDWRLASLLVSLLSTSDPCGLASVNQAGVPAWCGVLDGMTVLTNNLPDDQVRYGPPQFASVIMASNSPQASTIAAALVAARASQPDQRFQDIGDILAAPELSAASPWLNLSGSAQTRWGLTDEAYEAIPSQLLPLLRPDSVGSVSQTGGVLQFQFSGSDGYAYAVQSSLNLLDWTTVSTSYPTNGYINFGDTLPSGSPRRYYRSLLLP
jgi:hypothetical protein